ncbi:MAG TPA: YraN family protein [Anaerolineae bacterium]|nr:YraN family protein [Anaerolineae bacterium]
MIDRRRRLGQFGEALAARELERRGYRIAARNWRCPIGEIDLVAEKAGVLVFVEVRTRRGNRLGTPEESITPTKQAKLIETAQTYLQERGGEERDWRIDIVAVELSQRGELLRIDVIENAVEERS